VPRRATCGKGRIDRQPVQFQRVAGVLPERGFRNGQRRIVSLGSDGEISALKRYACITGQTAVRGQGDLGRPSACPAALHALASSISRKGWSG
jgi:hypothetical protein